MGPVDLKGHACLSYAYAGDANQWRFSRDGRTVTITVDGRLRCNNGEALTWAAVAGLGIVLQPTFILAPALRAGALEVLLTDWEVAPLTINAVWPGTRHLPAKVRTFVDFLVARFGSDRGWDQSGD